MSVRRLAEKQPASFAFSQANLDWAKKEIAKYPPGRQASAVISLLWRAQDQEGWVTEPAVSAIADMLGMPKIRVLEVATFYTMFFLEPVGAKAHIQVCGTTPCWLRGAEDIREVCRRRIHHDPHHLSDSGDFSWEEVECLGACVNAPMVQVGADTFEDLTTESFEKLLDDFDAGRAVKPGPQVDRQFSAPAGGPTTLTDLGATTVDAAHDKGSVPTDANKPRALDGPRENKPDNLKLISGVGPKLEETLNRLGIFHYDQIAAFTAEEIHWVDDHLNFKGRIDREDWTGQAKTLAAGGMTDFARRAGADET